MSTENLDGIYSWPAAVDLSADQYQIGVLNSSGQIALAGANALSPAGVIHNLPAAGEQARIVIVRGVIIKARLGGTVPLGSKLTTDATGRLVVATTGQNVCAIASDTAGVVGDIVPVLWLGYAGVAP
jgi:hypothetical protein